MREPRQQRNVQTGPRARPRRGAPSRAGTAAVALRAMGLAALTVAILAACQGPDLDTRTFEVQYLPAYQVDQLIAPYVFTDREQNPGMMSTAEGAVTIRETVDNLEKIARVLEEYDRPAPTITLHFQIIEADGARETDPAIAEVERELRRLFRFQGYDLVAETQIVGIQGTGTRQVVRDSEQGEAFVVRTGVTEVRRGDPITVTLDVQLSAVFGPLLETSVTIPAGHSVVLGTAESSDYDGALILVVRAEIMESTPQAP